MTGASAARLFMFHKPRGCVVTRSDERGLGTGGWAPVGRLDLDSRGLLLFTREGALVEALTGPGSPPKTYGVWVRGRVTAEHLARVTLGVETPVGTLACLSCEPRGGAGAKTRLEVVLDEGRNRHIRRLFGALADPERGTPLKVLELKRAAVGEVVLYIPSGGWRPLTAAEERSLRGGRDG